MKILLPREHLVAGLSQLLSQDQEVGQFSFCFHSASRHFECMQVGELFSAMGRDFH